MHFFLFACAPIVCLRLRGQETQIKWNSKVGVNGGATMKGHTGLQSQCFILLRWTKFKATLWPDLPFALLMFVKVKQADRWWQSHTLPYTTSTPKAIRCCKKNHNSTSKCRLKRFNVGQQALKEGVATWNAPEAIQLYKCIICRNVNTPPRFIFDKCVC